MTKDNKKITVTDQGKRPKTKGKYRDIFRAIEEGTAKDVEIMLKSGVSANKEKQGMTSLLDAIFTSENPEIVKGLILYGANVTSANTIKNRTAETAP